MKILFALFAAPSSDWLHFILFLAGIVIFIIIAEKTRVALNWPPEVTRKLVHIGVGVLIFFTPWFFESNRPLIWMAVLFIIIDYLGVRSGMLKGMHGTGRSSYGTVFYPLTFLILVTVCWQTQKVVLMLSMLILAVPDALAAIVGENLKNPHEYRLGDDKKSIEGSWVMGLSTFFVVLIAPLIDQIDGMNLTWLQAAWIGIPTAVMAAVLESISSKGSDNLTAPLGSAFIIWFMLTHDPAAQIQLVAGMLLSFMVAWAAFKVGFLSANGSVMTFILATVIFGAGGWMWAVPILIFFILSSVLSATGKKRKTRFEGIFEKSSRRDAGQVIANGGLPGILVILNSLMPHPVLYYGYLGALAAVNADTWATEIGILSRIKPRLITTGKPVPHGISGGITPSGLAGALLGAFMIAFGGWLCTGLDHFKAPGCLIWITAAGFTASLIDSLLGATLQGQYKCRVCKQVTEKKTHCSQNTVIISGIANVNNDCVNFICAVFGSFFMILGWISGICR
jgi:uncharacterized protein (TIGR00297 family)